MVAPLLHAVSQASLHCSEVIAVYVLHSCFGKKSGIAGAERGSRKARCQHVNPYHFTPSRTVLCFYHLSLSKRAISVPLSPGCQSQDYFLETGSVCIWKSICWPVSELRGTLCTFPTQAPVHREREQWAAPSRPAPQVLGGQLCRL